MEIIGSGLLGTGDNEIVDANMGGKGGAIPDGIGNILRLQGGEAIID